MDFTVRLYRAIYLDGELTKYRIYSDGVVINTLNGYELSKHEDKDGYFMVNLSHKGKHYTKKIHRLVAEYFIPNPENKPEIHHRNGNHQDNLISNLLWCTKDEHWQLERETGKAFIRAKGEAQGSSKYKDVIVRQAVLDLATGIPRVEVAKKYNIDTSTIHRIYHKEGWTHLSEDVVFPDLPKPERDDYSEEVKTKIVDLLKEGKSPRVICDILNIEYTPKMVNYIKTMRRRKVK